MNARDRAKFETLVQRLRDAQEVVEAIGQQIRDLADDERDKFDNLPEAFRDSERGTAIEEAADALEALADYCEGGDIDAAIGEALDAIGVPA